MKFWMRELFFEPETEILISACTLSLMGRLHLADPFPDVTGLALTTLLVPRALKFATFLMPSNLVGLRSRRWGFALTAVSLTTLICTAMLLAAEFIHFCGTLPR